MANEITIKETQVHVGDTIVVQQKIQEEEKSRLQNYEGVVIAIKGHGNNKMFTVRRVAAGNIGVERIWPVNSPWINKITVAKRGQANRAKLYYLRERTGRRANLVRTRQSATPTAKQKPAATAKPKKTRAAKKS